MKKSVFSLSRFLLDIVLLLAIFSISNGCSKIADDVTPPPPPPTGKYDVSISGGFTPAELTVSVGTVVTWANTGPFIQSVTSSDGLFDGIVRPDGTYSYKFSSVGTYSYFSRMYSSATGKVIVK